MIFDSGSRQDYKVINSIPCTFRRTPAIGPRRPERHPRVDGGHGCGSYPLNASSSRTLPFRAVMMSRIACVLSLALS